MQIILEVIENCFQFLCSDISKCILCFWRISQSNMGVSGFLLNFPKCHFYFMVATKKFQTPSLKSVWIQTQVRIAENLYLGTKIVFRTGESDLCEV